MKDKTVMSRKANGTVYRKKQRPDGSCYFTKEVEIDADEFRKANYKYVKWEKATTSCKDNRQKGKGATDNLFA